MQKKKYLAARKEGRRQGTEVVAALVGGSKQVICKKHSPFLANPISKSSPLPPGMLPPFWPPVFNPVGTQAPMVGNKSNFSECSIARNLHDEGEGGVFIPARHGG